MSDHSFLNSVLRERAISGLHTVYSPSKRALNIFPPLSAPDSSKNTYLLEQQQPQYKLEPVDHYPSTTTILAEAASTIGSHNQILANATGPSESEIVHQQQHQQDGYMSARSTLLPTVDNPGQEVQSITLDVTSSSSSSQKQSTIEREAYFLDYIEKARKITDKPLLLTGGFRTVSVMEKALDDNNLDVVGMARPFVIYPDLPNAIFEKKTTSINMPSLKTGIKSIDKMGFLDLMWHAMQIKRLGEGKAPDLKMGAFKVISRNIGVTLSKVIGG